MSKSRSRSNSDASKRSRSRNRNDDDKRDKSKSKNEHLTKKVGLVHSNRLILLILNKEILFAYFCKKNNIKL